MEECKQVEPSIPISQNRAVDHCEFLSSTQEVANRIDQAASELPKKRRTRDDEPALPSIEGRMNRRVLRSRYRAVRTIIKEEQEELCRADSDGLRGLIEEVDYLYNHVQTLREHRIDAETLFEIAKTFSTQVQSYCNSGVSPSEFMASLIHEIGRRTTKFKNRVCIKWKEIGMLVSPIFSKDHGCSTMIGPMNTELKQRRLAARRTRRRPNKISVRPEELDDTWDNEKTDTEKSIVTMFNILRKEKSVRLENLILNKFSFAQTIENLFALSFLVKDGRAKIAVDDKGIHRVSPRNAPLSHLVTSGEVAYSHFVFRFDFEDWKLMVANVREGEELMPHRYQLSLPISKADQVPAVLPVAIPTSAMLILSKDE